MQPEMSVSDHVNHIAKTWGNEFEDPNQRSTATDRVGDVWKLRGAPDVTVMEILNDWCLVVKGRPEPESRLILVAQDMYNMGYRRVRKD